MCKIRILSLKKIELTLERFFSANQNNESRSVKIVLILNGSLVRTANKQFRTRLARLAHALHILSDLLFSMIN